ncbi:hypothetical protein QBC43DRAFT_297104 [Cladorrhinum sp. PSN259]|nr:hypothetical protein QBC43DRAFT_297104 [Cladorrhinum sp. PSN259]
MKLTLFAILAATASVQADRLLSCGYHLVNRGDYTQSQIAKVACGRTDTCDGKEWNTLFEIVPMSSGPSSWVELHTTGVFCHKGCWGNQDEFNAQCH